MTARDSILEQAQKLIYEKGYVDTSIKDILQASHTGKGQLYHYFSSKKQIGLEVIDNLLDSWRQDLFNGIFSSENEPYLIFKEMLNWIFDYHKNMTIFYGCPVGNLIVELSTLDEDFRQPLQQFMIEWQEHLTDLLLTMHPDWTKETAHLEAGQVIASIQGAIVLLKVQQNLDILESTMLELEKKYVTEI